ncbi:glutamine--fructose-6-phosphate transaminase (isomerizing) [Enterovibrio coralii]|uniref:Glutamine--fructose-6-phosphate aminotransferase [isomerizing] n=1 Tax=Enterovibrio coralii TaxID=294935 RepID=A0A135IDF8_9GAMM|nr:glutamine--fructose-6-phosphate transaminase (isomerizing) [Enterovibrio coralii]KXF83511.1 glutamine--fructose-6-phosphate aminotransferase [Enterovibrio coralii]
MCGIFAAVSNESVTSTLVGGLGTLSYRGYDSSGIVVSNENGLVRRRAEGKLESLSALLSDQPVEGYVGIAHTRWATHGAPSVINAHPHMTDRVAVVHNGIIENYPALKASLEKDGYVFESETDSETIPQLISRNLDKGMSPAVALKDAVRQLDGSYAIAVVFADEPQTIYAARYGSPLVIGQGAAGHFISSDSIALSRVARNLCYLDDNEIAQITVDTLSITNADGITVAKEMKPLVVSQQDQGKQGYKHFMLKEIHQQPEVMRNTLNHYCDPATFTLKEEAFPANLSSFERLSIVACGTSYYAGMVARQWFERYACLPVDVDIASEYRYRESPLSTNTLALFISQSGETADSLAALRYSKEQGLTCLSLLNVETSSMAMESDCYLRTLAGAEIGVASTKAFTGQLLVLLLMSLQMGKASGRLDRDAERELIKHLFTLPVEMAKVIDEMANIDTVAASLMHSDHTMYLGRGMSFPLALEGALKLKEISYIHAEAYPAGELKHGPIALIDNKMPVVMIAPPGPMMGKTLSNLREVSSRGAQVILISNGAGIEMAKQHITQAIEVPETAPLLQPLLYTLPLQLLAYHVACMKGTDVDQPRNLAKSVTVE